MRLLLRCCCDQACDRDLRMHDTINIERRLAKLNELPKTCHQQCNQLVGHRTLGVVRLALPCWLPVPVSSRLQTQKGACIIIKVALTTWGTCIIKVVGKNLSQRQRKQREHSPFPFLVGIGWWNEEVRERGFTVYCTFP